MKEADSSGLKTRAPRYSLQMEIRYRPCEEEAWDVGATENISRSGVLFKAKSLVEPGTPIEVILALPAEIGGAPGAHIACLGRVVRALQRESAPGSPSLAVKILEFHFVRSNQ